jgi:hypothetical protein
MLAASAPHDRRFWTLQFAFWIGLMPAFVTLSVPAFPTWHGAVFNGVFRQVLGFFCTLGLASIYRNWTWKEFSLMRHGLVAVALCIAVTIIDVVVIESIRQSVVVFQSTATLQSLLVAAGIGRVCVYIGWSALFLSLRFFFDFRDRDLRLAQAELKAREAELHVLRAQLNPHFLFNALNSILAEADDNPARVKAITFNLAEMLRFSLRQRDHFSPLGEEIAAIESYLQVERARFEERLGWRVEVSPAARSAMVPASLLLPLVENAIKYGLQTSPAHLELKVGAEVRDGVVAAVVENSGRWIEPDPTSTRSTGIGLANLRRRLALLYGPEARVDISFPPEWVRVALVLPLNPAAR